MKVEELAAVAQNNFYAFPILASGNKNPIHLHYASQKIQYAIENPLEDKYWLILISMPPRHGKTERISKHLPPWYLGRYPRKRIILTSYSDSLASSNSDVAKEHFKKWGPLLFNVNPSKTTFNKSEWETDQGGGCVAAGFGGSLTGFGADLFIIDDYIKGREESESKLMRDKMWETWQAVIQTRLHPGAVVLIPSTRWHDDDLVGRIKAQYEKEGEEEAPFKLVDINFPAIAHEDDEIGRKKGDALWPWRYSAKRLENIKKAIGSYFYSALYDGSPTARGGTLFKSENFRYYIIDPMTSDFLCWKKDHDKPIIIKRKDLIRHVYVDPSLETKTTNDPTGAGAWGYSRKEKVWLLLDRLNDRIEHHKIMSVLKLFAFKNKCTVIGIENEKIGKILVKQSAGNDSVGGIQIPFKEIPTKGMDKYARATPMAAYYENERVFLPQDAPWLSDYADNLVKFPNAKHDEDVDITSMADNMESKITLAEIMAEQG